MKYTRKLALILAIAVLATTGLWAGTMVGNQSTERIDCPGTIECPITGNEICKDLCPVSKPCCQSDN